MMKNIISALAMTLLCVMSIDVHAGAIYLGDAGAQKIQQANLDGSGLSDLVTGVSTSSYGLAVDSGKLFWSGASGLTIQSINLDGSGLTTVATDSAGGDFEILGNRLYEADGLFGQTRVFDKNGTGGSYLELIAGFGGMSGMTSDGTNIFVYGAGQIIRVNVLTGLATSIINLGVNGSDLELHNGFFYFGSRSSNSVNGQSLWRIGQDGTGLTELVTSASTRQVQAISIANDRLYWTDYIIGSSTDGRVRSADLNGNGVTTLINGLNAPFSLYVTAGSVQTVPVPAAVWLFGSGLLGLIGVARRKSANI